MFVSRIRKVVSTFLGHFSPDGFIHSSDVPFLLKNGYKKGENDIYW